MPAKTEPVSKPEPQTRKLKSNRLDVIEFFAVRFLKPEQRPERDQKTNRADNGRAENKAETKTLCSLRKDQVIGTSEPRMKFGTVVATVARMFVPNCSAAMVTNTVQ